MCEPLNLDASRRHWLPWFHIKYNTIQTPLIMVEELQAPKNNFYLSINGDVELGFFPFFQDIYCKYSFVSGPDWSIVSGVEEGISQMSKKGFDEEQSFVWNLPLNITYKSSNPEGWPQLVISAYGLDIFGNDVVRGYGLTHAPVTPGRFRKRLPMFVPESSTAVQKFTSWLTGKRPEFTDPRILCQGDTREVVRTRSQGHVIVSFDTTLRGLQPLGYAYM